MADIKNIVDLYCRADNFYIYFNTMDAENRIKEIEARGKEAIQRIANSEKIIIFEVNK